MGTRTFTTEQVRDLSHDDFVAFAMNVADELTDEERLFLNGILYLTNGAAKTSVLLTPAFRYGYWVGYGSATFEVKS